MQTRIIGIVPFRCSPTIIYAWDLRNNSLYGVRHDRDGTGTGAVGSKAAHPCSEDGDHPRSFIQRRTISRREPARCQIV